jgi:hypothetical protein
MSSSYYLKSVRAPLQGRQSEAAGLQMFFVRSSLDHRTNRSRARRRSLVFGVSPESRFTPCVECGAWVPHGATEEHVCDGERVLDFRVFQLRGEVAAFDAQLAAWLSTARGRFAAWIAERDRLAREAST